ncbi:MAG TPA: hypothetical protein PLZ86_01375 [bacterium]|nr:hypothetical protein [bacterium]
MKKRAIIVGEEIKDVLREQIHEALVGHAVAAAEMTQFYLVNLLIEFHESQGRLCDDGEDLLSKPLAVRMLEGGNEDHIGRRKLLRSLGDTALVIAGFYAERVRRSIVDISYYAGVGAAAYGKLAAHYADEPVFSSLYRELSSKFSEFAEVLSIMAPWNRAASDGDILKIYERWLETGDENLQQLLLKDGINTGRAAAEQ